MYVIGLEGTAEKTGVGVISSDGEILFNKTVIYKPPVQGINPREAADHHAETFPKLLEECFNVVPMEKIKLVSFSQGPGLGPSLRVCATCARALSLSLNVPIIGVNHCISHVEIGKLTTKCEDPLTLYVSGGNTQILGYTSKRYRVFGETLDIAVGNCLDQFARSCNLPHPGGAYVEKFAKKGKKLLSMPYSVKGMDITFSGILTSAIRHYQRGEKLEDVCFSLQETVFSMLTEITERALSHTNKGEVMLVGGVAVNERLREMLKLMCEEQGVDFYVPPKEYCGDNGTMIAYLGYLMYKNGYRMNIEDTKIIPTYRSDSVEVNWIDENKLYKRRKIPDNLIGKGAEGELERSSYLGWKTVKKNRVPKKYRHPLMDKHIRESRTVRECRLLSVVKDFGIFAPYIFDVDRDNTSFEMSYIDGISVRELIDMGIIKYSYNIGKIVAKLHLNDIAHNDLTTSNFIVGDIYAETIKHDIKTEKIENNRNNEVYNNIEGNNIIHKTTNEDKEYYKESKEGKVYIIDFGLSKYSSDLEDKATDLLVLKKSIISTHFKYYEDVWKLILTGYKDYPYYDDVLNQMEIIERRGRYME